MGDDTPAEDKNSIALMIMSGIVINYEKEHYPPRLFIEKNTHLYLEDKKKIRIFASVKEVLLYN